MKDFFDKIKDKVDEGISSITTKSKETIELAKLRSQLRQLEKEKEEKLKDLGRLVYDMVRMDVYNEQKIKQFCPPIGEIDRQLVMTDAEIRRIQEASSAVGENYVAVCECGAGLMTNQKFCVSCGRDVSGIIDQIKKPMENTKSCSTCGSEIKETAMFCGKCGAKQ
jgi:hypothetical protein